MNYPPVKKIKGFEMVNGTLQWPIEEIYITNCLGAQYATLSVCASDKCVTCRGLFEFSGSV